MPVPCGKALPMRRNRMWRRECPSCHRGTTSNLNPEVVIRCRNICGPMVLTSREPVVDVVTEWATCGYGAICPDCRPKR